MSGCNNIKIVGGSSGVSLWEGATVTATQCDFMENGENGVECFGSM
jgi:hypothetical protein